MSYIAVFTNSLIIVYTGEFLEFLNNAGRLVVFVFLYHGLIGVKLVVALFVDDVPDDVRICAVPNHWIGIPPNLRRNFDSTFRSTPAPRGAQRNCTLKAW